MEDILSSIKRIIAEDGAAVTVPRARRPAPDPLPEPEPEADEILELTEPAPPPLVSPEVASASRSSLDALSAMVMRTGSGHENTLEGMVREMLRPMLKDWLESHLPGIVETLVAREIARITGKGL